jgi:hypothetical protein
MGGKNQRRKLMLNPSVKPDSTGVWWLNWTNDPAALLYDIVLASGAHVQAGKGATSSKLGGKPTTMPKIAAVYAPSATSYETAVDASAPSIAVNSSIKNGDTLSAPLEWTATVTGTTPTSVKFYIDGVLKWTEGFAPYVFNGDPGGMLDPSILSSGTHTFLVQATLPNSTVASASSTATVNKVSPPPPPPSSGKEGRVGFCMYATSQADKYDISPTQAQKDWMNQHWNRAIIYLDQIAAWYGGGWGYVDVLAIYTNSVTTAREHLMKRSTVDRLLTPNEEALRLHAEHVVRGAESPFAASSVSAIDPNWILRDAAGNRKTFYSSVQYLGDIGNPAYQDYRAQQIASMSGRHYKGVHCDDVNLDRVVAGPDVINPRTQKQYTLADWQRDFADMMTKIRNAAPKPFEIVHNSLWWASGPDVDRCAKQADVFELERGFNDPNYTPSQIQNVWTFVDKLHSFGVAANHLSEASGQQAALFNMACALMVSNGKDFHYGNTGWQPDAWNSLFDRDYGAALGPCHLVSGSVWKRDFERGTVTVDLNTKVATLP